MANVTYNGLSGSHAGWVEKAARAGYFTKGVLYLTLGGLSVMAAWMGGKASGSEEAVRTIGEQPFGQALLVLVGIGLFGYAAWKAVQAAVDTEGHGSDASGIMRRIGYAASSLIHVGLGITAVQLALGSAGSSGRKSWLSELLATDFGPILVIVAGLAVIAAGLAQIREAYQERYRDDLNFGRMSASERKAIDTSAKVGLYARGVVFPIMGVYLIKSGMSESPSYTKGVGGALDEIASSPVGPLGLGIVALGLAAYGVYMVASAKYRQVKV